MTTLQASIRLLILMFVIAPTAPVNGQNTNTFTAPIRLLQERSYQGKPITFWLQVLRDRNEEMLSLAFDAIRSLEEDAWIAVPDLSRLVGTPFEAIHTGVDSNAVIASKLYDIAVRTEAVDTLGWIGESAAPSTQALIQWALTERVTYVKAANPEFTELFVELVAMDAEQRMRVAGAVAAFGPAALPAVAKLLASPNPARRKFAVAILSQDALPVAAELLRSKMCEERELGLLVLKDMNLVVAEAHIDELTGQVHEDCSMLSKVQKGGLTQALSSIK